MKQQTAVEWLKDKLKETYDKEGKLPLAYTLHLVEQAKQLEKDQQFGFFVAGIDATEEGGKDFEQYYSNTFKTN